MSSKVSDEDLEYFDIDELVARANNSGVAVSVRAVRFYIQRGLFTKGVMVSKLPEGVQRELHHKGNQRFFTPRDVEALVDIKRQLDAGRTVAELGGQDKRDGIRTSSLDDMSMRRMLFTELNSMAAPLHLALQTNEIVLSPSEPSLAPIVDDAWTVTFWSGLTLNGTGPRPSNDAVRALSKVVRTHFAPPDAVSMPVPTGQVKIEIELADIAEPFSGAIVNSSNAELTAGGGASARIWDACGIEELEAERVRLDEEGKLPLNVGSAVVTSAGRGSSLGFEAVIHAHGPRWKDGDKVEKKAKEEELKRTWMSVLKAADDRDLTRLVTPAISSGLYGFPTPDVYEIAFRTLLDTKTRVQVVRFRTVSRRGFDEMINALQSVRHAG